MTVLDFQQTIKKNIIHAPGTKAGHHNTSPRLEKNIKLYVTKFQGLFELFVITACLFKAAFNNRKVWGSHLTQKKEPIRWVVFTSDH